MDAVKTALPNTKEVTSIRTIASVFAESSIYVGMLREVAKLVTVYLTFPVTSATAERSFSSLRRIKTYLRSSMTAYRLNNLFLLYVHLPLTEKLDLVEVAREFVSANSRRQRYFGQY